MSDLISRSELLKHCHRVTEYDEAGFSMEYNAVSVEDIKNAPTAYDVDKVVKELEDKAKNRRNRAYMIPNAEVSLFAQYLLGMAVGLEDEAIEIVKRWWSE